MADFQREERYLVVKLRDFHTEQDEETVRGWLRKFGVPTRQCVVVEHDWPIYEPVWDMVQRLVEGRNQKVDELQAHILNLNSIIHRLSCYPEDCDEDDYRHAQNVIGSCPDEGCPHYGTAHSHSKPQEELWGADQNCEHDIQDRPGGGIKCTKCNGWFCY